MKEKKARTSRVKETATTTTTTEIAEITDNITETIGKLPELSDAEAEILAATERHSTAERETALAVELNDKATGHKSELEGIKPNGQDKVAEPVPLQYLTVEAHKQRKLDVANLGLRRWAAETTVRAYFDKLVADGRPTEQALTLGEYRMYLLEAKRSAPANADKPQMFSREAFAIVRYLHKEAKDDLYKKFNGQTSVEVTDEFLLAVAEATVAHDQEFSLAIDGEVMNCGNIAKCGHRFIPIRGIAMVTQEGKSDVREFGNFRRVGTRVVGFCLTCKKLAINETRENGKPAPWFFPKAFAEKSVQYQEEKRNTMEGVRVAMGDADNFRRDRDQRGGSGENRSFQKPGIFNLELEGRNKNPFAALLGDSGDHPEGMYYSPEFTWNVGDRKVKSFVHLNVSKYTIQVVNAGPGLEGFKQKTFNLGRLPKPLFVAVLKARDAQQA